MAALTPASIFLERARYLLATEYRTKLRLAVEALPDAALWWRANEQSNSVGNLLLHLNGNVRQWMLEGVGGRPNERNRAGEFAARTGLPATALLAALNQTLDDVDRVLAAVTPEQLATPRTIQGRDTTVLDAVLHVVEHFSYHLGQMVLIAKMQQPGAVHFYEDAGGLATPVWKTQINA